MRQRAARSHRGGYVFGNPEDMKDASAGRAVRARTKNVAAPSARFRLRAGEQFAIGAQSWVSASTSMSAVAVLWIARVRHGDEFLLNAKILPEPFHHALCATPTEDGVRAQPQAPNMGQ
jgi:hypothetical protein